MAYPERRQLRLLVGVRIVADSNDDRLVLTAFNGGRLPPGSRDKTAPEGPIAREPIRSCARTRRTQHQPPVPNTNVNTTIQLTLS